MDLNARVDVNFARVDVSFKLPLWPYSVNIFCFILIPNQQQGPTNTHTKFQPNIYLAILKTWT